MKQAMSCREMSTTFSEGWFARSMLSMGPNQWRKRMPAIGIKQRLEDEQSMTHAVSRALRARVIFPDTSLEDIASEFSMQPRTLNRRLQAEGTTFRELINDARFEVARQLLKGTRMRIADIALALGYANTSGFSHAFQRWSGTPPSEWRSTYRDSKS
jgi:AraC-like DNA-binding protein